MSAERADAAGDQPAASRGSGQRGGRQPDRTTTRAERRRSERALRKLRKRIDAAEAVIIPVPGLGAVGLRDGRHPGMFDLVIASIDGPGEPERRAALEALGRRAAAEAGYTIGDAARIGPGGSA
jgi:hypothetical protein